MSRFVTRVLAAVVLVAGGGWSAPASAAYSTDAAPSWVPNGTVRTIARHDDVVYLGGDFTRLTNPAGGYVLRNRVAAVDADTGAPLPWNPGANATVRAITTDADGRVYLGGDFTTVGGRTATRLAAVEPDGDPVPGWTASASDSVHDLYADATSLWVGGRFGSVSRTSRPKLARLDLATGAVATGFNARVSGGRVAALEPSADGQSLLLGGSFTSVGGQARGFAAEVALASGALTGWDPGAECDTCYLWDLAAAADRVYAAIGGPGGRALAWDAATGDQRYWNRGGDGNAQAIDVYDGVVYVGGHFGPNFGGGTRHQLAALDAARGTLLPYTVGFTGGDHPGIWAVDAGADGLRIGGGFTLAGDPARKYALLPVV